MSAKAGRWIADSDYDIAERHAPVHINDFTSTKRFVCYECSVNMPNEGIQFPEIGIDWPCEQANALIAESNWDAILLGAFIRWSGEVNS